jgi:glycine cleavage system aminomethyltransferase T
VCSDGQGAGVLRRPPGRPCDQRGLRHTIGAPIAYAWLPAELSVPGTTVEIGYFDKRLRATVAAEPLFDPKHERIRR